MKDSVLTVPVLQRDLSGSGSGSRKSSGGTGTGRSSRRRDTGASVLTVPPSSSDRVLSGGSGEWN